MSVLNAINEIKKKDKIKQMSVLNAINEIKKKDKIKQTTPQVKKTKTTQTSQPQQPKLTPQQIAGLQQMKQSKQAEITKKTTPPPVKTTTPKVPYGTKGNLKTPTGENIPRIVNPIATGITKVASFGTSSLLPGMKEAEAQAQKQFPKSYIAGQVLGYAGPTGLATGLTKGLVKGATKKLATETGKRVVEGAIVGTTSEATQIVKPLITKEITPEQAAKQLATGLVAGAGLDIGIGILGKALKALPKSTMNKIKSGATLSNAEKNNIVAELGLPKGTTADDYIKQMQDLAKSDDIVNIPKQREADQVEQYYKSLEKEAPTQQQIVKPLIAQEQSLVKPITPSANNLKQYTVSRVGEKGERILNKPHGLYTSIVGEGFKTPYDGEELFRKTVTPKKPMVLEDAIVRHSRFGSMKEGNASSGIIALKNTTPKEEFEKLLKMKKEDLTKLLNEQFPGENYDNYYDSYELLEVLGAKKAKQRGYDALILEDKTDPNFSELVVLDDNLLKPITQATDTGKAKPFTNLEMNPIVEEPKQPKQYFTGSSNPEIKTFVLGGDGSTKISGDSYGKGVYLTSNPDVAKSYAQGERGKVYNIEFENPVLDLDEKANEKFVDTVYESLTNSDKQYRNRIIKEIPYTETSFDTSDEAIKYYDEMENVWKQEDGVYEANKPEPEKVGNKFIVKHKDFKTDLKTNLSNMTNREIFESISKINTDSATDLVMQSGFDGIEFLDSGAFQSGIEGKTAVIYRNTDKFKVDQPIKPISQATEQPAPIVKSLIEPTATPQVKTPTIEPQGVKNVAESFDVPKTESLNVPLRESLIPTANKIKDDGLGTAEQLRERIVSDVKKPKKSFDEFWKKAESQFIDDTAPLKHLEKKIKGKVSSAEESIYKTAGLYRGAPERASEIVRTGIKPAIQIAENAGFDHKDLRDYAIAVHAKEVNEAGINSGISTSSADDTIRKFGTPEMEAARQQLIKVSNKLVDDMFENGLLTKESYEGLKNKWKNYMPLFREFDDNQVPKAFGMSDKLSGASAPIKGLVGSERKVIDPLQGMIKNIYATENAIARNKVGLQLAKLSDIDVENRFIRKLDNGEEVGRKNVVNVMIDGKKVGYEVEPEVYKMLQGLDKETSNWIISIMSKPASVLRAGATLTPEFALRNPMRDVMNAYVISKSGFNPIIDFPRGLASVMKKDEYYEQFLKENGGFGNIFSMDRQSHKDALEKIIKQPNSKKFVNILNPNSYIELLRSVSDVTESATKVGEFRKALSKGETPQEAAYRARNLMDFGKAGSSIRPANKVVAFLNANIRGKATLIEAIKENPVKVTGKLMASMVLPTVAFKSYNNEYANENQKQTIKDAPQWLKDTFWLVAVPGTDTVARIPKPFDIAAVANGTDRFIDYVVGNDKEAFDGFAKNTIKGSSIPVMMTGVLPILEAMSNYSQFKQGPIIPEREKFLPRKYQSDSKTSELAKIVAGGIGKVVGEESNFSSPRTIDYVIRSSTGGLGSTALDAADWVAKSTGLVKKPPKPSVGITGLPIVKGFTVSELSSGKSVGDLYDLKNKLTTEKGGLKFEAKKSNKDPKKVKYENEETYKFVNDITDEISDISKEMRDVTEDMNMSPEEKRVKLKELNDKRNKLSYEALTKAKKMLDKNNR